MNQVLLGRIARDAIRLNHVSEIPLTEIAIRLIWLPEEDTHLYCFVSKVDILGKLKPIVFWASFEQSGGS